MRNGQQNATDTLAGRTQPRIWDTSLLRAKQGPARCPKCNQPTNRFCRKCNGNTRIQTQGRTRK